MSQLRLLILLLAGLLLPVTNLSGQDALSAVDTLQPGTRVRIYAPAIAPRRLVGSLEILAPDMVVLRDQDDLTSVPIGSIQAVEISGGYHRGRHATTVLLFAACGALIGWGFSDFVAPDGDGYRSSVHRALFTHPGITVSAGALVGGLIGLAIGGEAWRPVYP